MRDAPLRGEYSINTAGVQGDCGREKWNAVFGKVFAARSHRFFPFVTVHIPSKSGVGERTRWLRWTRS